MTVLVCGAAGDTDGLDELITSEALQLGWLGGPGSIMRAHPGHFAQLDRAETEAYVPRSAAAGGSLIAGTPTSSKRSAGAPATWPTRQRDRSPAADYARYAAARPPTL